jgi:hypothetical protein
MAPNDDALRCVVCGSSNVKAVQAEQCMPVPYGPMARVTVTTHACADCGEQIDATRDTEREAALSLALKASVEGILTHLCATEWSLVAIERALGLPARTLSRWKAGQDPSAAGVALLRIVRTYPWVLEVADSRYDPSVAAGKLLEAAASALTLHLQREYGHDLVGAGAVKLEDDANSVVSFFATFSDRSSAFEADLTSTSAPALIGETR